MTTFTFYSDSGHGWLAVKRKHLVDLGVADKISTYSYQRGGTAYLEEDRDASVFLAAWKEKYGERPACKEKNTDKRSPIRSYDYYRRDENES